LSCPCYGLCRGAMDRALCGWNAARNRLGCGTSDRTRTKRSIRFNNRPYAQEGQG
jgi:hypothetical protein